MLQFRVVLKLVIFITSFCSGEKIRYDNYKVYEVIPQNFEHITIFSDLERHSDSLRFFTPITFPKNSIRILVAPHKQPEFEDILEAYRIPNSILNDNIQDDLDRERISSRKRSDIHDWTSYHTLEENYKWLRTLAERYPDKVQPLVGGSTYEGREIQGVRLSFKAGNKVVFLEGGIHAREWISPATVTYILNQLLTSNDTSVRAMAEKFDWYVFPHVNPDGYVYTHTKDRMWRKTRSKSILCHGTDPNRNWDFNWNTVGASSFPCSESYAGRFAFSEIETRTLSEFIASLKGKIHAYLAFHSFSQLLLFPYGHTRQHASNHKDLQQIGDVAAAALAERFGTKYKVGNIYETIYPASGASVDWAYGILGVNVSYTYELRPSSSSSASGFILPANQIIPTGQETLDSLTALLGEAEKLKYFN